MRGKFILGDCMDPKTGIPSYPDNYFDLAIVDPPYFSGPEKRVFYGSRESSIRVRRFYRQSKKWEKVNCNYWAHLKRASRYYIFWGCNYYDFPFDSGRLVWDKCNDSSNYSDCEIAATNIWNYTRIVRYMWNGMLQGSISDGAKMEGNKKLNEKRIHPTQKPIRLYYLTLALCSDKIKVKQILSTHVGSASDLIVYEQEGFEYVGYELDPDYYASATKRMNQVLSQTRMQL